LPSSSRIPSLLVQCPIRTLNQCFQLLSLHSSSHSTILGNLSSFVPKMWFLHWNGKSTHSCSQGPWTYCN
jgi:hypothetical protein